MRMYKGEDKALEYIAKKKIVTFDTLASETGIQEDSLRRIVESMKTNGYVTTEIQEREKLVPSKDFDRYYSAGFPEASVFKKSLTKTPVTGLTDEEKAVGIKWAKTNGLVTIENGMLLATKSEDELKMIIGNLTGAFEEIGKTGNCSDQITREVLFQRRLVEKKTVKKITLYYTGKKIEIDSAFNVDVPSANAPIGKLHPITRMSDRVRNIMTELGFEEMEGEIIESSFWNFDALFQPQDHPARELADTFYVDGESELPKDKELVERVKKYHEKGWKYQWNPKEAMKRVLRTHTTALSARYLANTKTSRQDGRTKPRKYFAIGRVFRNEATDYKHLAEFHQVEGIIAWEGAKFTDLLGILKEFYSKLG
ncbi:hypothetical protein HZC07_03045, partial [Candidatus Micrarchaeota archaeon]|nr:hypothetical protein [Candidatus Micrarchaeota archaeon]